jgi:hypothetical protein
MAGRRKSGEFSSKYSDDDLYELVALVARSARPDEPAQADPSRVRHRRPRRSRRKHKKPPPPSARAVYMHFKPKGWKQIVAEAVDEKRTVALSFLRSRRFTPPCPMNLNPAGSSGVWNA